MINANPKRGDFNKYHHAYTKTTTRKPFNFDRSLLPTPLVYYSGIDLLKLSKRGEWRDALCPFHKETTASLRISMVSGGFRCMACGAKGGDVLAFHMLHRKLSFIDAAKDLNAWRAQ